MTRLTKGRLTPEREQAIRKHAWSDFGFPYKWEYENVCKFATDYEQQRDQLKCEIRGWEAALAAVKEENEKLKGLLVEQESLYDSLASDGLSAAAARQRENQALRERVKKLREALHKINHPQYWLDGGSDGIVQIAVNTLAADDEMEKK